VLIAALACAALVALHLVADRRGLGALRAIAKLGASACYVGLALALGPQGRFGLAITVALALSFVGDALLLSTRKGPFLAGVVVFLLAHAAFIFAFAPASRPTWIPAIVILVVTIQVVRLFWPHAGELRLAVATYGAVIAVMLWLALGLDRSAVRAGALLFWCSDLTVARDRFVKNAFENRLVGLPLYYAAQLLLASAVG
jgi:uncharacterized membrane protein YhhN